jgi:hypothetical protein
VSLYSIDEAMNKKYDSYVHFVKELSDFSLLFEIQRKSNYLKMMDDFGKKSIDNCIKSILFAHSTLVNKEENTTNEPPLVIQNDNSKPIKEPVNTDFAKFLEQKKLNEKLN